MQHRQNLAELQRHLRLQHPADIAVILDSLPPTIACWCFGSSSRRRPERRWSSRARRFVRSLIQELNRDELVPALRTLDADDLAFLSGEAPEDVIDEVSQVAGGTGPFLAEGRPALR